MWMLLRKELLANLLTLRLGVALVFTILLAVLTTLIGSIDYSDSVDEYERELRDRRQALAEATVYRNVQPHILVPPLTLSIFGRGLVTTSGQRVDIGIDYIPIGAWGIDGFENRLMNVLTQIDFTTVVAVLLSFLAVVLGFDTICGERERGTLRLLLTCPVPRGTMVAAKLLGGVISLCVPFALAFVICLVIALANPDVTFAGEDWLRLLVMFALSCLFLSQIFALCVMVSASVRDSATSLVICLFAWLVGGIGYVSALPSFSRFGVDEPAADIYRDQDRRLWDAFYDHMDEWTESNPAPPAAYMHTYDVDGVLRFGHPVGHQWRARRRAVEVDKLLERANESYQLQWANWGALAREAALVDEWSILSPVTNYQVLCYYLANTSLDDSFYLAGLGRQYRQTFIDYLRGKQAFSSPRWFTDDPPDQQPMIPDPEQVTEQMLAPDHPFMLERMAWAEQQQSLAVDDPQRQLDLSDMPSFPTPWKRTLAQSLLVMLPGLVVMILTTTAAFVAATFLFLRYDPR